jgi:hypothetical protein
MAAGVLGFGVAAQAAPSSFTAKAIHSGGAGALAVQATGGLAWYSRSVTLTSVAFYVRANECARFTVIGVQGSTIVDSYDYPSATGSVCPGSTGRTYSLGSVPLDGSWLSGGITEVFVYAEDVSHSVTGYADCDRAWSSCVAGQY